MRSSSSYDPKNKPPHTESKVTIIIVAVVIICAVAGFLCLSPTSSANIAAVEVANAVPNFGNKFVVQVSDHAALADLSVATNSKASDQLESATTVDTYEAWKPFENHHTSKPFEVCNSLQDFINFSFTSMFSLRSNSIVQHTLRKATRRPTPC